MQNALPALKTPVHRAGDDNIPVHVDSNEPAAAQVEELEPKAAPDIWDWFGGLTAAPQKPRPTKE
jgi:hypothetical protein